jgi:L-fucose isomerase
MPKAAKRPVNFDKLATAKRKFKITDRALVGHVPTIAITPVVDGRDGAYEDNLEATWRMAERVHKLISENVCLPDGTPVRVVVPPEIVYGPRTGALAQQYYTTQGVSANIWVSRSWAYSDELMSACQGIGSSEWVQAAYGLNQTDRPGAVWLKAFCAAMDEKRRPIFSIYNPDLEDETQEMPEFVKERLLRFARCATTIAEIRGKNYLSVGSVSMGIIGSDVRRNMFLDYLGMGTVSVDMVGVKGRLDKGFYDHEELEKAFRFMKKNFKYAATEGENPRPLDDLLRAGGTQGQRQWTDLYPNFDMTESMLCSSFDWNGPRPPMIVATENDSKNAIGMLVAHLLTGLPQLFADIRTNWTAASIKKATGVDVSKTVPHGLIDKRNSGAGALDYALDIFKLVKDGKNKSIYEVAKALRESKAAKKDLMKKAIDGTTYERAVISYFPGDGLSSSFRTPGGVPMTAYRYNAVGGKMTCSIVEGETLELPAKVADHIAEVTNQTWPESYWVPRGMTSAEYMAKIGPNHDANSFGHIGADMITLNAMLRIPVDMHNVPENQIFRPTMWDRFGGDDFRACDELGPLYG